MKETDWGNTFFAWVPSKMAGEAIRTQSLKSLVLDASGMVCLCDDTMIWRMHFITCGTSLYETDDLTLVAVSGLEHPAWGRVQLMSFMPTEMTRICEIFTMPVIEVLIRCSRNPDSTHDMP